MGIASEVKRTDPILPAGHRRLILVLGCLYGIWWLWLCIAPLYPGDWWVENILVGLGLLLLILTARWFVFSRTSYVLAFLFLCLHTLGAHYTYAEVPMDAWFRGAFGLSVEQAFGWQRNHFDRIVHFLYGLLVVWPYRELYFYLVTPRNEILSYLSPIGFVLASSAIYELIEWAAALIFGKELGMAYLGTQGDVWDPHQDIFWAAIGSVICVGVIWGIRIVSGRDIPREWGTGRAARR